jgi:hypothetical protein
MTGRRSRRKGARTERSIANGFAAVRVPLSGTAGGRFAGDIVMPLPGRDLCVEGGLYSWLNERDLLIVKADRHRSLRVVRLSLAAEIARNKETNEEGAV